MRELGGANLIFDLLIKKMYTSLNFVDIHSDYMVHFNVYSTSLPNTP